MQTEIIIPAQKTPFLPREFFLGEARQDPEEEDGSKKGKDKKLELRLVASEQFEQLIKGSYDKETLIQEISQQKFHRIINEKEILDDGELFGYSDQSAVRLDVLLWGWKFFFQNFAKGKECPIRANSLGNVWKVDHQGEQFKAYCCINFLSKDVYMDVKKSSLWIPDHTFFLHR